MAEKLKCTPQWSTGFAFSPRIGQTCFVLIPVWSVSMSLQIPVQPGQALTEAVVTTSRHHRAVDERRCRVCERVFKPSSRHLRCPACRARDVCACGNPKQAKSLTCGICRTEAADANGNWKGGRTRHKAGYTMVRAPRHPRVGRSPYVFEHILVAEELLGRHLVNGETVHHRNGTTTGQKTLSFGQGPSPRASGLVMPSHGRTRKSNATRVTAHLQQPSRVFREDSWRWRESNPRPPASQWVFSERSRCWIVGTTPATGGGGGPYPTEFSLTARRRSRSGESRLMSPGPGPQD